MVKLIYSPQWFYGKDILIDIISIFVLLLIALFSLKYYRIKKNRNYLYLASSFILLASSFLFKILMNLNIYYKFIETKQFGLVTAVYQNMKQSHSLFFTSFLLYYLLTLFGVYALYSTYQKQSMPNHLLLIYLIFISTYLTYPHYYLFHLTLLILLGLVAYTYSRRYINKKHFSTKLVAYSFWAITISQIFYISIDLNNNLYIIGELIQLVGYSSLLIAFIMVLRYGRKENKDRHHW
ncbi:MAG: hypothetical protein AABX33_01010 [Nanoarchaeota archaeon]